MEYFAYRFPNDKELESALDECLEETKKFNAAANRLIKKKNKFVNEHAEPFKPEWFDGHKFYSCGCFVDVHYKEYIDGEWVDKVHEMWLTGFEVVGIFSRNIGIGTYRVSDNYYIEGELLKDPERLLYVPILYFSKPLLDSCGDVIQHAGERCNFFDGTNDTTFILEGFDVLSGEEFSKRQNKEEKYQSNFR